MGKKNDSKLLDEYLKAKKKGIEPYFKADDLDRMLKYIYTTIEKSEYMTEVAEFALKLYPNNKNIKAWRSKAYILESMYNEALEYLESLPYKNDFDLLKDKFLCYIQLGRFSDLHNELMQLHTEQFSQLQELMEYVAALLMLGRKDKEIEWLLKFVQKIHPEYSEEDYEEDETIAFYRIEGKYDKVVEYCEKLLEKDPYNAYTWYNLGQAYEDLESYEKAIEAFDFALASVKKNNTELTSRIKLKKAEVLMYNDSYIKSLEILDELEGNIQQSLMYLVYEYKATCHYYLNDYENAYANFKEAYKLDSSELLNECMVEFFGSCVHTQHFDEAKALMEEYKSQQEFKEKEDEEFNNLLKEFNIEAPKSNYNDDELSTFDLINKYFLETNNRN